MDITEKLHKAIKNLKSTAETSVSGDIKTKSDFNKIQWLQADNTWSTSNPHSEITWSTLNAEMKRLQTEYDGVGVVQRKRAEKYPSVQDFMEAYTEKEIGGNDTKWNEYKTKYNKVRTDNPKE